MPTLLPNARQTFTGPNGAPLSGGSVYMYIPNTSTFKDTYQDVNQTILNTNPIILDANGQASIWGTGEYRQRVLDVNNNLVWDQITEDTSGAILGNYADNVFVASHGDFIPGTTTTLTLTSGPGSQSNMWVFFDGVFQQVTSYTLSLNVVTFTSPIPLGVSQVDIKIGNSVSIGTPNAGSVTDVSVSSGTILYNRINDLHDLRDYGALCNGSTDDTAAVNAAISALSGQGGTLLIPGPTLVSSNVTFPGSIILFPINGGYIVGHAGTEVVTISSIPLATNNKIFSNCVPKTTMGMQVIPEWFGAVGDGATDNINYMNKMVAFLASGGGGSVLIPPNTYYCSAQININSTNVSWQGQNRHLSRLLFGQTNGLVFNLAQPGTGSDYQGVIVSNMTILTSNTTQTGGSIGNYAIGYLPSMSNTGSPYPSVRVKNLEIRGTNGFLPSFWNTGIYLNEATNVIVDDVVFLGAFNYEYMSYGVYADTLSISTQVTNCQFSYMGTGVIQYSNESNSTGSEGLQVIGCEMVLVGVGVRKDNGSSPQPRPLTLVTGCFINATANCVQVSNCTESVIVGNAFYIQDGVNVSVSPGAACITLNNPIADPVNRHVISGNILRSLASTPTVYGCVIQVGFCTISGCSFDTFKYGIILTSTANTVAVTGCVFANIVTDQIQNQGTGNGSWYSAKTVMADNSSFNIV